MANKIRECFTPTSLWAELRKAKSDRVTVIISRRNPYDIYSVMVQEQ